MITWKDYHRDLARIFDAAPVPWAHDIIRTDLEGVSQPVVVRGPDGELIVNGGSRLFHSQDDGHTWALLCEVPPPAHPVPDGFAPAILTFDGCGVTPKGTLLAHWSRQYNDGREEAYGWNDDSYHCESYVLRSEDRGRSWDEPRRMDPGTYQMVGSDRARFTRMPDGRMALPLCTWRQSRPGRPLDPTQSSLGAFVYESVDDGETWQQGGSIALHACECDLLAAPSGKLLVSIRYQRRKLAEDPPDLAAPEDGSTEIGGHSVIKQTAVAGSIDGGKTWSAPRLATGWLQQTACLVGLPDGTLVMPFGYKTEYEGTRFGQRFMLSYDEGRTWSRTVYQLHKGGLYASSVALDDGSILTVHDDRGDTHRLTILRWHVPPREVVERGGFFEPGKAGQASE